MGPGGVIMGSVGLPDLLRRGASARVLREGSLLALTSHVADPDIADLVRTWAPDAHLADDGRFLFGRSLQLVGPLEPGRSADIPQGTVTVHAIVHRRDRPIYELDADALAAGLARRLGGWNRREARTHWSRPLAEPCSAVYAPRALTAAEVIAALPVELSLDEYFDEGFTLRSADFVLRSGTAGRSLVTFPLVRRQHWFTGWERTAEYRIEPLHDGDPERAAAAATALAAVARGVLLDTHGFPQPR